MEKQKESQEAIDVYQFPIIPFKQGDFNLVCFVASSTTLWNILEINRREEDKDIGYQRALSPSRVRAIANYIKKSKPLPLSILVTLDKAILSEDGSKVIISNEKDAGWVIDGQHRLAGAHESEKELMLPVIAFIGLQIEEQIQQFITINKEAKGVPSSLYYDLLKHIPHKRPGEYAKERAVDIAQELKKDEESPFYGRIVITTSPKKGELSLTNFVRKVHPLLLEKGSFHVYSEREQVKIIDNYYIGLKNAFPKRFSDPNSIFFQTLGFGALMNALPIFFSLCLKQHKGFTVENTTAIFNEIHHFDFDSWKEMGTGTAAENQAGQDLITELTDAFILDDNESGALLM